MNVLQFDFQRLFFQRDLVRADIMQIGPFLLREIVLPSTDVADVELGRYGSITATPTRPKSHVKSSQTLLRNIADVLL